MADELSHVDSAGLPRMVDVSSKPASMRAASAVCLVVFPEAVWQQLQQQSWNGAKGSIVQTAIVAGVQASKRTAELIPFCHSLLLTRADIRIDTSSPPCMRVESFVSCCGPTGVEMEAMTAAAVAALTIYDMCKALSHEIRIGELRLVRKTGGKSAFEESP